MKIKKEYLILVIVVLALSLYLLQRETDKEHYQVPKLPEIVKSDISRIEVSRSGSSISLNKKDDKWRIEPQGYPAKNDRVRNMLETIGNLSLTTMVSESKNFNRYDLNDEKKITVKAFTGDTLKREFNIGKPVSTFSHTFIKMLNDHRVYHARENFRSKFDQAVDDLTDKTVLSFDKNEVMEIELKQDKGKIVLVKKEIKEEKKTDSDKKDKTPSSPKKETVWLSNDGQKGDNSKIDGFLGTLSRLLCQKYLDGKDKKELKDAIYTVRLKGSKEYTLSIFSKPDKSSKTHPAVSSQSDFPFELSEETVKEIILKREMIFKKVDKLKT